MRIQPHLRPRRKERLLRAQVLRGKKWAKKFVIEKTDSKHVPEPVLRSLINRALGQLNNKVLTPHQIRTAIANANTPWIRVNSVEELARIHGPNNYLYICLKTMKKLSPLLNANVQSVQEEYNHAKSVIDMFRDPETIYFSPLWQKGKHSIVFFSGPEASYKKILDSLMERLIYTDVEYYEKIVRDYEQASRSKDRRESRYHLFNRITGKFEPVYRQ